MALENPNMWENALGYDADSNDIPTETDSNSGAASVAKLFDTINSISVKSGGVAPDRLDFNGLFKMIGEHLWFLQKGGLYRWENDFSYDADAVVFKSGILWISKTDNNQGNDPETDDGTNWIQLVNNTELNTRITEIESKLDLISDDALESINSFDDLVARIDTIESALSDLTEVVNKSAYLGTHVRSPLDCGEAGGAGFGLGYLEDADATELNEYLGLTGLTYNSDPYSPTYGNYIHDTNGSIICLLPQSYVRIGYEGAEHYSLFGVNTLEVLSPEEYDKLSSADAEGFVIPELFYDGGLLQPYALYAKYQGYCDPDSGQMICSAFYDPTVDTGTETGYAYSFIDHARAVGYGWNIASVYFPGYITILIRAHAQKLASKLYGAWYDPDQVKNNPWPYNLQGNRDDENWRMYRTDITTEMYRLNAHNGQLCGIMDLAHLWERCIGMTAASTSSTTTTGDADADIYLKSRSSKLADIESGFGGENDNWGTEDSLTDGNIFEKFTNDLPFTLTDYTALRWGNGDNAVFTDPTDTDGYGCKLFGVVAPDTDALSDSGSNAMGCAYYNRYWRMNDFPLFYGRSTTADETSFGDIPGVFGRAFHYYRTNANASSGARLAAYGPE